MVRQQKESKIGGTSYWFFEVPYSSSASSRMQFSQEMREQQLVFEVEQKMEGFKELLSKNLDFFEVFALLSILSVLK